MALTLAEMMGAVDFPVRSRQKAIIDLVENSEPPIMRTVDGAPSLMAELVDLERGVLMQSSIGK
jgi:hypothetical protein